MPVKVMVATVPSAHPLVQRLLGECPLDFASSFGHGERLLQENHYSDILVGHLFAESRMFDFAGVARSRQPSARVICIKGAGPPLSDERRVAIDLAVRAIGCEGFVDLTAKEVPDKYMGIFSDILREYRRSVGQPP